MFQSDIAHIIYATDNNKEQFCTRCRVNISKYKWSRGKGVCNNYLR